MSALNSTILHFVTSEDNQFVAAAFGVAALLVATTAYYSLGSKEEDQGFPKLPGTQWFHAWDFFKQRHDFLQLNFERNSGKSFTFNVLSKKVITLTGEDARRLFYSDSRMDFREGVKLLMGSTPKPRGVGSAEAEMSDKWDITRFNKTMNKLLSRPRIQNLLPALLEDIIGKADKWGDQGKSGTIDPFVEIYKIVFHMTTRMATCNDLAENEADLKKMGGLFSTLITTPTPTSLILPWFPSPARLKVIATNIRLFLMLRNRVEARRHADPTNDPIDLLIAEGQTTREIVMFIATVLFAGITNTTVISCWILIDLAINPEWREKCKKEIKEVLSRHFRDSSSSLYEKLHSLPVAAWEEEFPVLDACSRESHRIAFTMTSVRRNVGDDINICGGTVKWGDFLAYPMTEVHLNPDIYPEPLKYDPGRWLRPDPAPKVAHPFLGWGAGRHPCAGMKVAKLEMKWVMAVFMMRFDYELVDESGKFPRSLPVPNRNDAQIRPLGGTYYFKFKKVME